MVIYTIRNITGFVHLSDDPRISSITYPGVRTLLSQQGPSRSFGEKTGERVG